MLKRRSILELSAIGVVGGIAGCTDDASVSNSDLGTFDLGETAVISDGESEFSFTPHSASFHNVLVSSDDSRLSVETPSSGDTYLIVSYEIENTGSGTIRLNDEPILVLAESQYESEEYFEFNELRNGVSKSGELIYPVEYAEETASLIADFSGYGDGATATWEFNTSELDRETLDYSELNIGEEIHINADNRGYRISVLNTEETQSYESDDGEYTYEADDGNKLILTTVRANNTGNDVVDVPTAHDFALLSGSSQYEEQLSEVYYQELGYQGGEIAVDVEREGVILFEVPETISIYTIQVELSDDVYATWSVQ